MRTVVVQPLGGLGNQLFQYAAGLACVAVFQDGDADLWIDAPDRNGHSTRDYWEWGLFPRARRIGADGVPPAAPYFKLSPPGALAPWSPTQVLPYTEILLKDNYYQYYPAIAPAISTIRADIHHLFSNSVVVEKLQAKYAIFEPATAFLHIRRGDYLNHPTIHWPQSPEYLREALTILRAQAPQVQRILVVSDDPEWCAQHPLLQGATIVEEPDELSALALMTLCHAGAIIANSTFSWWGAMLGPSMVGAPVIYPRRWYGTEVPNLFPSHWIPAGPPPPSQQAPQQGPL